MAEPLPWCHLNGERLRLTEARVSPLDRSFLFGDGIYEVIPVYDGRLFRAPLHLARLARSAEAIRLRNPHDAAQWTQLLQDLVAANGGGDQYVYVQLSRGAEYGRNHAPLPDIAAHGVRLLLSVAGAVSTDAQRRPVVHHGRGHALGASRHQVGGTAGQCAAAPAGGGCRRRRNDSAAATAS